MRYASIIAICGLSVAWFACSSPARDSGFDPAQTTNGTDPSGSGTGSDGGPGGGGGGFGQGNGDAQAAPPASSCKYQDSTDHDGDGFSFTDGDCNDCDPNANPGAFDVAGNMVDEDCNGTADDEPTNCDTGLTAASTNGFDGAKAIGLCRQTTEAATGKNKTWGVISANYVLPDGTMLPASASAAKGHSLIASLGVNNPQDGKAMLSLSSGDAGNNGTSAGDLDKKYTCTAPPGYPKDTVACGAGVKSGPPHDGSALELTIRVPTNAKSFSYQENFFTSEFPIFICETYNDFFVALLTPTPPGLPDANIAFDQNNDPISVNNSLLQVCSSQKAGGKTFACPLGASSLANSRFADNAATGWLQTQAPVKNGDEITIRFAIWDSEDGIYDSTVLIDKWQWSVDPAMAASTAPAPSVK